ncbi:hypothetical protein ACFFJ7_05395 [Pseudochelatococcus lubricantis]|uniref:hypothetical protein n=1 Tax=Pseudochelatococcus lubricantis TaxID=1538102 RepID=UPI0035E6DFD8
MERVEEFLEFVKGQADFHDRQQVRHSANERRASQHARTAGNFRELANFLERQAAREAEPKVKRLALGWDEIEGLPEELLSELSVSESDRTEFNILSILDEAGGVISLDRLLVEYYKLTGDVMKRQTMNNRLYRMGIKELVFSVPGKKGVYSNRRMDESEAAQLS